MTVFLKQSTSIDIRLGPFLDVSDGFTPETGVTIAGSDEAEILKANGAATVAMTGTLAAVTNCDGWYDYTLATGDVDTVGELVIVMHDDTVYLPVFVRAYVVEEVIYDAYYASGAVGATELPLINTALDNIPFAMVDETDGLALEPSLTVAGQRSIDAGAYGNITGTITEVSAGSYQFDASAADMNGAIIMFKFTAAGAATEFLTIRTRPQ